MNDLATLTIKDLRSGLRSREFTSKDVVKSYLARIERHADLNCFLELAPEKALEEAEAADVLLAKNEKKPLLGIPISVKDVIVTRGIRTTCGSKMLENFIPPYDATVISKLRAAGAVVLGKTNMDEFAMGSSTENSAFGPVKNPWNSARVPGGSSGGSAAAVAARLCAASLGTDTGGSVRQPAALCGVVGMKPTYGRVSRYGVVAYASSLDQVGPLTASVSDCAELSNAICGYDERDSTSVPKEVPDFTSSLTTGVKGLRIGVPKEYFISGLSADVDTKVREAMRVLETLGATLIEISLPHTGASLAAYYILAPAEASSNLARFDGVRYGHRAKNAESLAELYAVSRSEGFGREVVRRIMMGSYVLSAGYYDAYYRTAQKVRTLIAQDFTRAFEDHCDLILAPVSPTTAFELGAKASDPIAMYLSDIFTIPVNLAGLPAMSIPCGFDRQNLPIGLQLIGKPWDEATIFRAAGAYEASTDWHRRFPELN